MRLGKGCLPLLARPALAGLAVLLLCLHGGCWDRKELDQLAIIAGVGIDWDRKQDKVLLSLQIIKPSEVRGPEPSGGSGGGGQRAYLLLECQGKDIYAAVADASRRLTRRLDLPHNEVLIIGQDAARRGISQLLDYFARHPESRPTQLVMVAKGKARDVLACEPTIQKVPASSIGDLLRNSAARSETRAVSLEDITAKLMNKTAAATAPMLGLDSDRHPMLLGTAVFKGGKMVGFLDRRETRGFLWITGKIKSGLFLVVDDGRAGVETTEASGRFQPVTGPGGIGMRIKINAVARVASESPALNSSDLAQMKKFEQKTGAVITGDIQAVLDRAKKLRVDPFGFSGAVRRKFPRRWPTLEPRWEEILAGLRTEVKVKIRLSLIGNTTKPLGNP